jgi:acylphosphatase
MVDVEGSEEKLKPLIDWCHQGPVGARVEKVEVQEMTEPFVPVKMG